MNCILVPTLALDISLLQRLATSVDYPVENKVVINNGKPGALLEWNLANVDWQVIDQPYNLGVAASWNLTPKVFEENAWLIINDDQELQPGCLEKICKASDEHDMECDIIYINQYEAFDIFVWTRKGFETFGGFDENFYPAYYEDWEMRTRFNLGNAKVHIIGDETFPVKHGKRHPCGERYHKMLADCDKINREYFIRKWGSVDDKKPLFKTPFNNPDLPLSYWQLEKTRHTELKSGFNKFITHPEVSLYEKI